jgi:hypothetical protein
MQRRLRIALAIVAATGALALGAGTAAADPISDILGGANSNNPTSDSQSDNGGRSDADNNGNSYGEDGTDGKDGDEGGADGKDGDDDTNTSIAPRSDGHSDSGSDD